MPCMNYPTKEEHPLDARGMYVSREDKLAQMLCALITMLEQHSTAAETSRFLIASADSHPDLLAWDINEWWLNHKEQDAKNHEG